MDDFLGVERKNPFSGRRTEPRQTLVFPPYAPESGAVYYYKDPQPGGYIISGYGQDVSQGPIITINRAKDLNRS
ncbi:MAG: hypothetical protein PHO91_02790 [Patescibacteria group bacterium]|nr:hypothetical protein [Patescibacteria group bacterium]